MRCGRRRPGVGARGVIVAPAAGVRESVVGIVDLLEFLGACWTGRVVVGYAIGVVLEGCSERALAGVSGLGREGGTVYRPHGSGFGLRWRKPQGYHLGRGVAVRSGGKCRDRRRLTIVDRGWFQRKSAGPQPYYSENGGHTRGHDCGVEGLVEKERGEEEEDRRVAVLSRTLTPITWGELTNLHHVMVWLSSTRNTHLGVPHAIIDLLHMSNKMWLLLHRHRCGAVARYSHT